MMADGFSFAEALQPAQPKGFSFAEAMAPPPASDAPPPEWTTEGGAAIGDSGLEHVLSAAGRSMSAGFGSENPLMTPRLEEQLDAGGPLDRFVTKPMLTAGGAALRAVSAAIGGLQSGVAQVGNEMGSGPALAAPPTGTGIDARIGNYLRESAGSLLDPQLAAHDIAAAPEAFPTGDTTGGLAAPHGGEGPATPSNPYTPVTARQVQARDGVGIMEAWSRANAENTARSAAAVADIGKATDIDGAIAAAGKAAQAPTGEAAAGVADTAPAAVTGDLFAPADDAGTSAQSAPAVTAEPDAAIPETQAPALSLIPKTSAEAKAVATAYYQRADEVGGTLLPEFTNKFVDKAESIAPQTPEGRAIAGDTAITGLVNRVQELRDKPISLQGAQEIDERLGDLIDKEFGLKGLSKEGHNLLDLQTTFRNMILDAGPADTTNGTAGFEAIKQGRMAWAQAMKMMDFERILNRADQTDNPVTSIRAGIRTLTSNPARLRGYTPEEIDALKDAASRGVLGGVLHVFGSRLAPLAVGAAGLSSGVVPGLIGAGLTHSATAGMRNLATRIQLKRADNAMSVLGAGVPSMPAELSRGAGALERTLPSPPADAPATAGVTVRDAAVDPAANTPPAPPPPAPTPAVSEGRSPRAGGAGPGESIAFTPSGAAVPVRYTVRDASDLVASQLADGRTNPAFPAALQPRDRTRAASIQQVNSIANRLQPERLGASASTSEGAPIIGPDGAVESGNGRTMAIMQAYADGGPLADAYRQWVKAQGHDTSRMQNPVLVRERIGDLDMPSRAKLASDMGASPIAAMSAPERAAADARAMPIDMFSIYQGGDVTLAKNAPFARAFAEHVIPPGERAGFMTADGEMSADGAIRIRNALTQHAYGSNSLVTSLAENADPDVKMFGGALMDAAGEMAKLRGAIDSGAVSRGSDIAPDIVAAAQLIQTARRQRISLADAVGQRDAFSVLPEKTEDILQSAFGDNYAGRMSRGRMADLLSAYAQEARMQSGLFGANLTAGEMLAEARAKYGYGTKAGSKAGVSVGNGPGLDLNRP